MKQDTVTLILTNSCNLNCVYCYEHHKNTKIMSVETATKILSHHLNQKKDRPVVIEFFGGEPFLAFPIMPEIVTFLKAHKWKRPYRIFIDTNGTLITAEIAQWLAENLDVVSCGLSLDGTPQMHNLNRSNSFENIDIDLFKGLYPDMISKMTVSKESLPTLCAGVQYMHSLGIDFTANLAYGVAWDEADGVILARELKLLADWYLEHPEYEPCSIIDFDLTAITDKPEQQKIQMQYCGAGNHMHAYDVDGQCYPCHFFTPLTSGDRAMTVDALSTKKQYDSYLIDEKCQKCCARNFCPTCLGSNYLTTGDIFLKDIGMCDLLKIQIQATAYLKYHLWKQKKLHLSLENECALLKGIELCQSLI